VSTSTGFFEKAPVSPEIAKRFADLHPALTDAAAMVEANRCLYCFDAPCTAACPTHIDVPKFIKKIASDNLEGSARTILDANILGASCSRACPVEVLCEGSCVMHRYNKQPIQIGRLQRFAMDALHESGAPLPFVPGEETGLKVALIGAGPASLACAAELRRRGIRADLYDARALPGGLNTYGIAEYKLPLAESLREIGMLAQLGVNFYFNTIVDAKRLAEFDVSYDAVFLGVGLGAIHKLGLGEERDGEVTNALDFIAGYKSGAITSVAAKVAVIGAGNTAIDAAIAAVRLGAVEVSMIYRRGPAQMSAFEFEYEHAKQEGVRFVWHMLPAGLVDEGEARMLQLVPNPDSPDVEVRDAFGLAVDLVVLAIGQVTHAEFVSDGSVNLDNGRIVVDRVNGQTSNPKYFAGGDCTNGGREVVDAVADGKRAGVGVATYLEAARANA
jgi:dihydropyrimidine dehydrogenase (NAD+) subunit PreT